MALVIVRHTRPDIAAGICYGQRDLDVATSFGQEAAAVVERLPAFGKIVASPLLRCRRLAEHVGEHHGKTPVFDRRLVELDFGRWDGQAWDDIPRHEIDAWADDVLHARPHDGESIAQLQARVVGALADHVDDEDQAPPLIVAHSGVIRAVLALVGGPDAAWNAKVEFGEHIVFARKSLEGVLTGHSSSPASTTAPAQQRTS